ncbi:MAG: DinB family protein [Vicinamibacterales bacterium]
MKPDYELSAQNVAGQLAHVRERIERLLVAMSASQLNWQPDGGRRWSVGQCLGHIATSTVFYAAHIDKAVVSAPSTPVSGARPNPLGRAFIWLLEPPVKMRTRAPKAIQPKSSSDPDALRRQLQEGWAVVEDVTSRALKIDSGRVRFENPLANGRRVFNVAAGVFVLLAHARRHVLQAEQVKARADFPSL